MTLRSTALVPEPTRVAATPGVHIAADGIPRDEVAKARQRIASLQQTVNRPLSAAHLTLRRGKRYGEPPYAADASVLLDGRLLAAHAVGRTALEAANGAADRLRRQLWAVGAEIPSLRDLWSARDVDRALAEEEQRGWRREGEALVRELAFRDFDEAMRFVERVASAAVDHLRRPDFCILEFNRVRLRIANPHHGPLTLADARLAAKVDAVIAEHRPGAISPARPR